MIEEVPFERRPQPDQQGKGLLLDVDGTLRETISGDIYPSREDDFRILPNRRETLQRWIDRGYQLFLISNQSGVASKKITKEQVEACFSRTLELLGLPVTQVCHCPHPAFPISCFCRKPMPGFGVELMRKYKLSQRYLVMVGDMDSDAKFAQTLGATYYDAKDFFAK